MQQVFKLVASGWRCALLAATACGLVACGGDTEPLKPSQPAPAVADEGHKPRAAAPDNMVGGFAIQLPDFTLEPGEERFPCWIFPLEVEGPSRVVGGGLLNTTAGMHHGNVTTRPSTGTGFRPCEGGGGGVIGGEALDILSGGAVLFGSTTQLQGEEWQSFPSGMGYPIVDGYEIVARMHYLNATADSLTVAPSYEWFTIDEASVEQLLGPFAWQLTGWEIPPLSDLTVEASCRPPGPMNIVNGLPHMHELGNEFFGTYVGGELDGQRWLNSQGYDPEGGVLTQWTPAVDLSRGESTTFGCTWRNHHDKVIVEGVGDNEMCILFGYAYPYENSYSATANVNGCVMVAPPPPGGD